MNAQSCSPAVGALEQQHALIVDDAPSAGTYVPMLRACYAVTYATTGAQALTELQHRKPTLVITELTLPDASGVELCRAVRASPHRIPILVTTSCIERVASAIVAGCNGVLLKPFAPNLLFARLSRLRAECSMAQMLSRRLPGHRGAADSQPVAAGTNRAHPDLACPKCGHRGVTSFDNVSHRRMWCACLACEAVWIAAREEEW
jgi:DNA-binding response OmpR family regulator